VTRSGLRERAETVCIAAAMSSAALFLYSATLIALRAPEPHQHAALLAATILAAVAAAAAFQAERAEKSQLG
jgi:hypothetical protein